MINILSIGNVIDSITFPSLKLSVTKGRFFMGKYLAARRETVKCHRCISFFEKKIFIKMSKLFFNDFDKLKLERFSQNFQLKNCNIGGKSFILRSFSKSPPLQQNHFFGKIKSTWAVRFSSIFLQETK